MSFETDEWRRAAEFHGHVCMGLTIGYRVAKIALAALKERRAPDEELIAVVENDACGVDAIMVMTGCTPGKGNFVFRDTGKNVYTFGSRNSGKAIRISVNGDIFKGSPEGRALQRKVIEGSATAEERAAYERYRDEQMNRIMDLPEEEFAAIREVDFAVPGKARLFASVKCSSCGEYAMEPRTRNQDGNVVCLDCFEDYTRTIKV
ncbi:MAG TPA: formylmethanofuran dehydrogenase [Firmicutes bacterium]|jgi:formylmethanofuran dehydrogenase subunit E|nr:formylmethanofuran dehydrogenase [Bacillota bacterium]